MYIYTYTYIYIHIHCYALLRDSMFSPEEICDCGSNFFCNGWNTGA